MTKSEIEFAERQRDKLVELLSQEYQYATYEDMADGMIANGVTVQEWISVKDERKPKQLQECLCVCQFDDDPKGEWRFYNVLKWMLLR